jgi:integrase
MPHMSRTCSIPSYRRHKQSGQAVVTLPDGLGGRRDVLLGKYGTVDSRNNYLRVTAEWEANGRRLSEAASRSDLTVNELALAYWRHAEQYYRHPDGAPTSELACLRAALRPLKELYGHTVAKDFGPLALKDVRQRMIESKEKRIGRPWSRRTVNLHICRVRALFRWGVEQELIPAEVLRALRAVRGLSAGRSSARETEPVKPVPLAFVRAALPFALPPVRAMIELQLLTGMRPGEVVILRAMDLDMSGAVWIYRPGSDHPQGLHKTAWHGHGRVIAIGPRGQQVLRPFLKTELQAYLFSPKEAVAMQRVEARARRKTKVQPSQQDRRKRSPQRSPGDRYSVNAYRHAIARACKRAGVPVWKPHQLRHTKATEIRREAGLDAARAVLGHRSPVVTEVYAEVDMGKAAEIMERLG